MAFLDADDLFGDRWLASAARRLERAEAEGERVVAHPELNWVFGGSASIFAKPDQDDPLFAPLMFYVANYYDSLCMAPRAAHEAHPYAPRDIPDGLSFQDWQFAVETMAGGWRHVSVPDTIIFKRRREASLVTQSAGRRAVLRDLDALRIDRVRDLHRPDPQPRED